MNKRNRYNEIKAANRLIKADIAINNVDVIDVFQGTIIKNYNVAIVGGQIVGISKDNYEAKRIIDGTGKTLSPGFIDPHIHIESSYLTPGEFIKTIAAHGTTTAMVDCHELANTNGMEGIEYFMKYLDSPFNLLLWVPSCVPASEWEHNYQELDAKALSEFYSHPNVLGLGEMMDFVGVNNGDKKVIQKIEDAHNAGLLIDGHFPGHGENNLNAYLSQNITADHESTTVEEVMDKISRGFHINLRYGDHLMDILNLYTVVNKDNLSHFSICGDDVNAKHLRDLGHLDIAYKSIADKVTKISKIDIIKMMTINTARANQMRYVGGIAPGYRADLVLLDNLDDFNILKTIANGEVIYEDNQVLIDFPQVEAPTSHFDHKEFTDKDFDVRFDQEVEPAIIAEGFITHATTVDVKNENGVAIAIDGHAKVSIIDRYNNTDTDNFTCYAKDFGIKEGAVAITINHDSHNTIVVGQNDSDMAIAVNRLKEIGGGFISVKNGKIISEVELSIGGQMTTKTADEFIQEWEDYFQITTDELLEPGTQNPIIKLRALGLSVLPEYRLTLHGLLDVTTNKIIKKN